MSAHDQFHQNLHELVVTLRDRCRKDLKSRELSVRFQEALTILEAAQMLKALREIIFEKFRQQFATPVIVNAVRQRDWVAGIDAFKQLASDGIESRRRREEAGEKMDDMLPESADLAACLSMLTAEMCGKVIPIKNLDALFKHGACIDTSTPVRDLILGFNDKYCEFLENMCVAFPRSDGHERSEETSLPEKLQRALMYNPTLVYDKFTDLVKPHVKALQDSHHAEYLFSSPHVFFGRLPYMDSLPLAEFWVEVVHQNEVNYAYLTDTFTQLLVCSLGLPPSIMSREFIGDIRNSVMTLLEGRKDLVEAAVGADGQPDMGRAMAVAMQVVQDMQNSGALKNLLDAVGTMRTDINPEMLQVLSDNMQLPDNIREDIRTGLEIASLDDTNPPFHRAAKK